MRLEKAFDDFIKDQELLRRADKTVDAYRAVKRTVLEILPARYLDEVTRRDLLQYAEYLRKREGLSDRTVHTRWTAVMTVLKHHNVRGLTKRGDTPQYVEEEPVAYTQAELDALFKVCKPTHHLLFSFYLVTGFRMKEVMYLKWSDLNLDVEIARVTAKREYGFIPKRWHERTVPIEKSLLQRLRVLRKARKASDLVFPTRNGKPNGKHLVALKRLAKKAKLDPERFLATQVPSDGSTQWLRKGVDVKIVQVLLGHRSLLSTMRYLASIQTTALMQTPAWKAVRAGV